MKTQRLFCSVALGLTVVSCGKIRDLANKAKRVAETGVAAAVGSAKPTETPPDPRLQALVDQTPEGAVFRKDLPFPEQLQAKVERRLTFEGARIVAKSAIGSQVAAVSGTQFFTTRFERSGQRVELTMESAGFAKPEVIETKDGKAAGATAKETQTKGTPPKGAPPAPPKGAPPTGVLSKVEQAKANQAAAAAAAASAVPDELTASKELTGCKLAFERHGKTWKAEHSTDFKLAVWGGNLAPHLEANCINAGVLPRTYWFGKRRLKPGDSVPLSGAALTLLLGDGATGALELKLESFEANGGHPCGVFAVTGNYHAAAVPGPDGVVVDQEVSITSGKVWLSLVYPIIIREQLETVQTITSGARGGHTTHIQGKVSVAVTREWKATVAAPQ